MATEVSAGAGGAPLPAPAAPVPTAVTSVATATAPTRVAAAPATAAVAPSPDAPAPTPAAAAASGTPAGPAFPPPTRPSRRLPALERLGRHAGAVTARLPLAAAAVVAVVLVGTALRFATDSRLWLDEALTVDIAVRPLPHLFTALRHDGAPPLYYVLLHGWVRLFGSGDVAVRALSGVASVATLPLAWLAGRRVGRLAVRRGNGGPDTERRAATASLVLFATSPYAIRYGSETRMYSLVVLLVLMFGLALARALERPGLRTWVPLSLTTAALAYTHYWTFLLLASVALGLLVQSRRRPEQRGVCRATLLAMLASALLFVPWLPTFAFQMLHTGTPWAPAVHAQVLLDTVFDWAGPQSAGALLALLLLFSAGAGLTGRTPPDGRGLVVDLRGRSPGRMLAFLWLMPLALAYLAYLSGGSAYAERYTGIALPAFLLLCGLGLGVVGERRVCAGVLVVAAVCGLLGGYSLARRQRTQAPAIAGLINNRARPGDVVAYCPDQLAPAVHRALRVFPTLKVSEVAYADPSGPLLVDWVDYASRMRHASSSDFATMVDSLAGPTHAIFLVRADGYRTLEGTCGAVSDQLAALRDRTVLATRQALLEGESLERFSTTR